MGPLFVAPISRQVVIDSVAAEVARSGMRMDRFLSMAAEGVLADDHLQELWRANRDALAPDWAA